MPKKRHPADLRPSRKKPVHPSLAVFKCLCSHTKSRHRGRWGEAHAGACKDCVCEQYEDEALSDLPSAVLTRAGFGDTPLVSGKPYAPPFVWKKEWSKKAHPAANLFPMLPDSELRELAADIKANGLHDPIILTHDELVLDGRNRLAACKLAEVEPDFEYWSRADDNISPTAWVISKNLHRRHLTTGQRALLAIEVIPMLEKEARARERAGRKAPNGARVGKVAAQAAAQLNVGTRTVERAKATIAAASKEEVEQIRAGKKTVNQVSRQIGIRRAVDQAKAYEPPKGQYPVIVADPPWQYDDELNGSMNRGLEYPTMELSEICALQLPAAPDCILWLWTTKSHLLDGSAAAVLKAWGFEPRSMLTWVKSNIGLGRWLRNRCEFAILAIRGNPAVDLHAQEDVLLQTGPRLKHSEKPPEFFALVESLCPAGPKLEMFARAARPGWITSGSELPEEKAADRLEAFKKRVHADMEEIYATGSKELGVAPGTPYPPPKPGEPGWVCPRGCGKPYGEHAGTKCPRRRKFLIRDVEAPTQQSTENA